MATRTTIRVATESFLILLGSSRTRAWCPDCSADREMFLLEDLRATGLDSAQIDRWLAMSGAHRVVLPDGSTLFCFEGLLGGVQDANPKRRFCSTRKEKP
jgi:hypothetical protein